MRQNKQIYIYDITYIMDIARKLQAQYNYINHLEGAGIISTAHKNKKFKILKKREEMLKKYQQQVYKSIEKNILSKKQKKEKGSKQTQHQPVVENNKKNNLIDSVLKTKD